MKFSDYTETEILEAFKGAKNVRDVLRNLNLSVNSGSNYNKIMSYARQFNLLEQFMPKSNAKLDDSVIFVKNSSVNQHIMRKHYKDGNYSEYKCSICGLEPFWNGKELTLTLDHKDGDNTNNELSNLRWVCPNCDRQLPTFGSKNRKYYCVSCGCKLEKRTNKMLCCDCLNKLKEENNEERKNLGLIFVDGKYKKLCPICNKAFIQRKSSKCEKCNNELQKKFEISRDELKGKIRSKSFTEIGKEYGVSDNAVRKRCRQFNLPFKKEDIKKYSDKDWIKL